MIKIIKVIYYKSLVERIYNIMMEIDRNGQVPKDISLKRIADVDIIDL